MKKILALLMVAVMMLGFVGCGSKTEAEPKNEVTKEPDKATEEATTDTATDTSTEKKSFKIGVSIMELTAYTWYQGVIDGCNKWIADHGNEYGVDMSFTFEDSRSDVQTMLTNVENMVSAGSDGVILFPADASSAIPTMKEYTAAGIPFVIGDYAQEVSSDADKVWSTFVGHDMKALGKKAAEEAIAYFKEIGKEDPVCLFITRPTSGKVSQDRFDGFKETILATYPNAKIIEEGDTGAGNRDSAQTLMENILQREATIDLVCGHNDAEVVGAYNAAVAQGRNEIKFIGIAGDIDVLTWISEGNEMWLAEVLQDPVVLGYQATDAIYKVLALDEDLPDNYDLPEPDAITPANVSQFDWKSWGWLG